MLRTAVKWPHCEALAGHFNCHHLAVLKPDMTSEGLDLNEKPWNTAVATCHKIRPALNNAQLYLSF